MHTLVLIAISIAVWLTIASLFYLFVERYLYPYKKHPDMMAIRIAVLTCWPVLLFIFVVSGFDSLHTSQ